MIRPLVPSSSTAAQGTGAEQQLESVKDVYCHPPSSTYFLKGGRKITDLRFADDINSLAGEEEELAKLVERLDKASTAYGMEISAGKTKLMTNNTSGINTEIKIMDRSLRLSQASSTWAQL